MSVLDAAVYSRASERAVLGPLARWGYRRQLASGSTPSASYRAMRKLYGSGRGEAWDALVARAAAAHPVLPLPEDPSGLATGEVERAVAALREDGFVILGGRLDEAACAELEAAARAATCNLIGGPAHGTRARYDEAHPQAVRYDLDEQDAVAVPAAQRILADESLLAVAQAYLGAAPIQDLVAFWWSTTVGTGDSSVAAQQFHFDLDRLRFLKVFVFLTDVDEGTGPHVYARGSHRQKPEALRHDGRHRDAAVEAAYPGATTSITGRRGTVFLADTIGLHKGMGLRDGHRLVFQLEYATSLFGAPYQRPSIAAPVPELAEAARRHPWTYQRFQLPDDA